LVSIRDFNEWLTRDEEAAVSRYGWARPARPQLAQGLSSSSRRWLWASTRT